MDMLSKNHTKSHPVKKVGFFCYRCDRDDFGLNQKSLSAHVRYCSFDLYSMSLTKRKSDHLSSSLHSSGTAPYPLLVKKTHSLNNSTVDTANLYLNTSHDNNVDVTAEEGCANGYLEEYSLPIHEDFPFQDTNIETSLQDTAFIEANVIDHSFIPSTEDSAIPYDPNCVMPLSYCFQLDLIHALSKHRINLNVHDEIIQVIKKHSSDCKLNFSSYNLLNRKPFLTKIERDLSSTILKPKDILVNLNGGRQASVAVFNLEAMILSLVLDDRFMHPDNIADGYDLFTGKVNGPDNHYGEIHTGDAWIPARNHFCGEHPNNMPLALVIFGDKSHLDLHGSLSTLPLTFTLSCFNEHSRNKSEFWRPLSFIPNLSYGSSSSKNSSNPHGSVQDEHDCLKVSFLSLMDIHKRGGISATVMGRPVILKVWIHFFCWRHIWKQSLARTLQR